MPGIKSESIVKDESDEEVLTQEEPKQEAPKDEEPKIGDTEEAVKHEEAATEPVDEPEEREEPPSKKRKVTARADPDDEVETHVNENREHYIELSNKRRATVREFKGSTLIDLREYYTDKSGEEKPGAKGMSLTAEQWQTLKSAIPQIDAWVAEGAPVSKKSEASGSKRGPGRGRGKGRS